LFDRIQPRTLRAEIVDMHRDAIVSGRPKPGEHLKESIIAEQMSVSRIPVREAFRQLEQNVSK
jgi:DNA-binding GntR family transcriptional regulator